MKQKSVCFFFLISEIEMSNKGGVGHTFGNQQSEEKKHRVREYMFNLKQFRPRPQTDRQKQKGSAVFKESVSVQTVLLYLPDCYSVEEK